MKRRDRWFGCILIISTILLANGCEFPFSTVERPDFDNPVDPESRVPIEEVIALIEAENSNPNPLVQAILDSGARYNTDIEELWFWYGDHPVSDLTGIVYLPRLRRFALQDGMGAGSVSLAGFVGHTGIQEIEVTGFDPAVAQSIPPLPNLRRLDISGTTGTGVNFSLMYEQTLDELIARDAGISTLANIERLGPIKRVDIRGAGNTYTDDDLMNELVALADSLEMVRSTAPISIGSFIASYPNLSGFGFEFTMGETLDEATLSLVAGYPRITFIGFYGFSTIASLSPLAGSGVEELELHQGGGGPNIDVSPLSNTPLRRINLSEFAAIAGISTLPATVEDIAFINSGLSETNGELDVIASTFPVLRFLDISHNIDVESLLPISQYASTMINLEEIRADQGYFGAAPPDPYGIDSDTLTNGIAELGVLPELRFLSLRNTRAAYEYSVNGIDIGLFSLWQANPDLDVETYYEF